MAIMYVDDNGSDTSPYDTWAKAAVLLSTALAAQANGEDIYISSDTVEQYNADTTLGSANGTKLGGIRIISVNKGTDAYETMETGGGSLDAKTNGAYDINITGNDLFIGCTLIVGDNLTIATSDVINILEDCTLEVEDVCFLGSAIGKQLVVLKNVIYKQGTPGSITLQGGNIVWRGGSFELAGGTITTVFVRGTGTSRIQIFHCEDVDFSGITDAGDYLINGGNIGSDDILFKRCKLSATYGGVLSSVLTNPGTSVKAHSCSSADVIHDFEEHSSAGIVSDDTATYLDATYDGTNEYSVKMVSSANVKEYTTPLKFKLCEIYIDAADPTITVELNTDNVVLQDDEFAIEIEAPNDTVAAFGNVTNSLPATILTTPVNLDTSVAAWTEGFGTEKPQSIELTLTNGAAGVHTIWAYLYKPSTTVYVSPKVVIS